MTPPLTRLSQLEQGKSSIDKVLINVEKRQWFQEETATDQSVCYSFLVLCKSNIIIGSLTLVNTTCQLCCDS